MEPEHQDQAILHLLKRELEIAKAEFDRESAAIRAGTLPWMGLRPKAEAYTAAMRRYYDFLITGKPPE
jgi:hypothetical protein